MKKISEKEAIVKTHKMFTKIKETGYTKAEYFKHNRIRNIPSNNCYFCQYVDQEVKYCGLCLVESLCCEDLYTKFFEASTPEDRMVWTEELLKEFEKLIRNSKYSSLLEEIL